MTPDIAYANADFIDGAEEYPARWAMASRTFRRRMQAAGQVQENLPYGPGARQVLDLFMPAASSRGLVVFLHGGYWRAFDKTDWSHLAAGALARGWSVAIPSYTLAPKARISAITCEVARAIEASAGVVSGPIILTGHSAGGHLVARMNCADVELAEGVAARIKRILPISPLSDLRPLLQTAMNADFRLDMAKASAESPLLHEHRRAIETHVWVGADERPAFLKQARWLAEGWDEARLSTAAGCHHFDVIDGLEDPKAPLINALLSGF